MIKPRHLQQLTVLTELGSFNRASEVLHMSQPSLTNSIKKLENELGVVLFERNSKGIKPTIYTQHILKKAPIILEELNNLENEILLLSNGEIGKINIGAGPILVQGLFKDIVPIFTNLYPNVEINIVVDHSSKIFEGVKNGIFDLGICHSHLQSNEEESIKFYSIFKDPIVFATKVDHPLVTKDKMEIHNYLEYPFALPKTNFDNIEWFNDNYSFRRKIKIKLTSSDYDLLIHSVKNTEMIMAAPMHFLEKYFENKELHCLEYRNKNLYWNAVVICQPITMYSKYVELFLEMIQDWFTKRPTSKLD